MTQSPAIDVMAIGEVLIDFISLERADSLREASTFRRHAGGSPANLASNVARLGRRAAIVGKVGAGAFGQFLRARLREKGVLLDYLDLDPEVRTSVVFVSRTLGTPDFEPRRDADFKLTPAQVTEEAIAAARIVHASTWPLSREPSRAAVLRAFQLASSQNKRVSFDPNYSPVVWPDREEAQAVIRDLYRHVTLTKASLDDSLRLFGERRSPEAYVGMYHDLGPQTVVLTMGKEGSLLSERGRLLGHLPARPVEVRDVTGAGDAFWAGFLVALLDGHSPERCLLFAREVAELKLQTVGGLPAIDRRALYARLDDAAPAFQRSGNAERVTMEFHVSRSARDRYQFDQSLYALSGNVLFANLYGARVFAQKMNQRRDLLNYPEQAVKAGQINAMGLIDEVLHLVVGLYRQQRNPSAMGEALAWLEERLGREAVDETLRHFADAFPPLAVYRRETSLDAYWAGETEGVPHRQLILEEMLLLWLTNANTATMPFRELFDDADLERETAYRALLSGLRAFFDRQPVFGPEGQNLVDMLRAPAIAEPHSLAGQLEYIRERWGYLIGRHLYRLLSGLDLISEEARAVFAGPGPAEVYDFSRTQGEYERFTPDREWMPRAVLMAKNSYVWLDQLSKRYGRPIVRLDQIPDQELDALARGGFTGLWLIGLWERSRASRTIKQLCGNPDAVASAYSLFDYRIADDLGGHEAYQGLRDRAWARGIRLASDMVPNHMGIDSPWVIEHPDWFIGQDYSPFPAYTFDGPDLCWDGRVGIYIEDHYYERTDAAVVFKWRSHETGHERYILHGNDGTSMPWNDTAQLNYLDPVVREAITQKILDVAKMFPIIRFDAAMTLAKRHYRRLWFPEHGSGGAIPSRAEHAMTAEQFDALMPTEFWRDVVDRLAEEAPDTLLLAEAFWLMEGYFVRTLGMHRVYNSAFMNMLRDEKNAEYRLVIRNTIEFDPRILERYVNFMNNPDERTAIDQFGDGDKYLGICTMLATMPGLPMFGHGQVEGLHEKYGMEYRRAYWDEMPNTDLVAAHERTIYPLLRDRRLFAGVENFLLYDFVAPEGHVNEDVYAYSNGAGDERYLVVYHNRYAEARGWMHRSVAYATPQGERVRKTLGQGLGLSGDAAAFCIYRDHVSGLEYIRSSQDIHRQGLYMELGAYRRCVLCDFREVQDNEWGQYAHLNAFLDGRGVPSIEEALYEVFLQPIHAAFRELVNAGHLGWLIDHRVRERGGRPDREVLAEAERRMLVLLQEAERTAESGGRDLERMAGEVGRQLQVILGLAALEARLADWPEAQEAVGRVRTHLVRAHLEDVPTPSDATPPDATRSHVGRWATLLGWAFVHPLGRVVEDDGFVERSRSWMDEWLLGKLVAGAFQEMGLDEGAAWWAVGTVKILIGHQLWHREDGPAQRILSAWLRDGEVQQFLQVNRYRGELWFNHEAFGELVDWMLTVAVVQVGAQAELDPAEMARRIGASYHTIETLRQAEEASEYRVAGLVEAVRREQ